MSGSRTQLEAPQGSAKPRREAGPVELIAAQRTAANMLLSVALTAPLYVAKAVSRKPLLMAGRDAGNEHAADARAPPLPAGPSRTGCR